MNRQSTDIRAAIDAYFADVDALPSLRGRVLAQAKGVNKMKKKLSAGVALAIALLLLAAGAVAVVLSMRQLVEDRAIPMANQYAGDSYTAEDTNALLQLAEQNGITLSGAAREQIQRALDQGAGYFKEEMLMALAKAEFGEAPQTWTLEQQKWFDDACVAIGFIPAPEKGMPEGGEDAKAAIIQAASAYIRANHDAEAPLEDSGKYRVGAQYINGDADGEYPGMYWSIDYQPLYPEGAEYWVYLRGDGAVLGDVRMPGIEGASTVSQVRSIYNRMYGSEHTWEQSTLRAFRQAALSTPDAGSKAYMCLARTSYPDIPANAISREAAHALVAKQVGFDEKLSRSHIFLIGDDPNPVWKVTIAQDADQWFVEIDCVTGEVKAVIKRDNTQTNWWRRMALSDVVQEVDDNWLDYSPPGNG